MNRWSAQSALPSALLVATIFMGASPARADVMEVGPEGARWVTGDLAQKTATIAAVNDTNDVAISGLVLPAKVVANVSRNAAGVPAQYAEKIAELSRRFDLSPSLLEALVWQESRWRERAVSHAGARGLTQLMPATARDLGVDPDDPMQNLEGGARYLRAQLDRFDGNLEKALAAYNAGPQRVLRAGGVPNIRETKRYVTAIMGRLASHSRSRDQ